MTSGRLPSSEKELVENAPPESTNYKILLIREIHNFQSALIAEMADHQVPCAYPMKVEAELATYEVHELVEIRENLFAYFKDFICQRLGYSKMEEMVKRQGVDAHPQIVELKKVFDALLKDYLMLHIKLIHAVFNERANFESLFKHFTAAMAEGKQENHKNNRAFSQYAQILTTTISLLKMDLASVEANNAVLKKDYERLREASLLGKAERQQLKQNIFNLEEQLKHKKIHMENLVSRFEVFNNLELGHRQEIDNMKKEIARLKEEISQLKKDNDTLQRIGLHKKLFVPEHAVTPTNPSLTSSVQTPHTGTQAAAWPAFFTESTPTPTSLTVKKASSNAHK